MKLYASTNKPLELVTIIAPAVFAGLAIMFAAGALTTTCLVHASIGACVLLIALHLATITRQSFRNHRRTAASC